MPIIDWKMEKCVFSGFSIDGDLSVLVYQGIVEASNFDHRETILKSCRYTFLRLVWTLITYHGKSVPTYLSTNGYHYITVNKK